MARLLAILALVLPLEACRSRAVGGDPTQDARLPRDSTVERDAAQPRIDAAVPCEREEAWEWTHPDVDAIYVDPGTGIASWWKSRG